MTDEKMLDGEAPKDNHLALGPDAGGFFIPLPAGGKDKVGTRMLIVDVATSTGPQVATPVVLVRASHRELVFKCACSDPDCTRIGRFKAKWTGQHRQMYGIQG